MKDERPWTLTQSNVPFSHNVHTDSFFVTLIGLNRNIHITLVFSRTLILYFRPLSQVLGLSIVVLITRGETTKTSTSLFRYSVHLVVEIFDLFVLLYLKKDQKSFIAVDDNRNRIGSL